MRGRQVLFVVILVMGLTAVAASLNAPAPRVSGGPPPRATATQPAEGGTRTVEQALDADGEATTVRAHVGDIVRLRVTASEPDSVTLGGDVQAVDPTSPASLELYADAPGEYPIRLVGAGRLVGTLLIRP